MCKFHWRLTPLQLLTLSPLITSFSSVMQSALQHYKMSESDPWTSDGEDDNDDGDSFDDEEEDDPFDMFTGEVIRSQIPKTQGHSTPVEAVDDRNIAEWHWLPLRGSDEIRVLDIDISGGSDDIVRMYMRTTSVEDPCQYYTLSYAWGKTYDDGSHLTHVVDCDGVAFRITANLHDALVRLRGLW